MYIRPASHKEVRDWLLANNYAKEKSSKAQVSADELAEALLAKFEIITESTKSIGD